MRVVYSIWKGRMLATPPPAAEIIAEVAAQHGLSVAELRNGSLERRFSWPRAEAAWRLRQDVRDNGQALRSYPRVAALLGMKDHTSARSAVMRWPEIRERMLEGAG